MRSLTTIAVVVILLALGSALAPRMNADAWDQLTKLTFSEPVEIPGQVLPPGTYWFKLLDSQSDRNIVQIYNNDQTKLYATDPGHSGLPSETHGQDRDHVRRTGGEFAGSRQGMVLSGRQLRPGVRVSEAARRATGQGQ